MRDLDKKLEDFTSIDDKGYFEYLIKNALTNQPIDQDIKTIVEGNYKLLYSFKHKGSFCFHVKKEKKIYEIGFYLFTEHFNYLEEIKYLTIFEQ